MDASEKLAEQRWTRQLDSNPDQTSEKRNGNI
jgi:hypothetical protein